MNTHKEQVALASKKLRVWGDAIFDVLWPYFLAAVLLMALVQWSPLGRDDSDQQGWFTKRSLMSIRVDHFTGCQYFHDTGTGGLTPRLNADGKQICGADQ